MKIEATTTAAPASPATPGLQGTQDEFLKLFMAQLQHQDPFQPTSGADMVAQLAQLSSVEQAKQTNAQLAELAASQASAASAALAGFVGRDCSAAAGAFQLDAHAAPPPLDVSSAAPMKGAAVVVEDAAGKELRRIPIPDGAAAATLAWDGKDAAGNAVAPGSYQISVDAGSSARSITTHWHGRVDAVELTEGGPRLRIGGVLLAPSDIRTIGLSS
jgi:flagellar basal-body rod modification protein FlgD